MRSLLFNMIKTRLLPRNPILSISMTTLFFCILNISNSSVAQSPPYSPSPVIFGINWDFSTRRDLAPGSDNWVITWSDDDHQYTSWGDGGGFGSISGDGRVSLGFGRVEGTKDNYTGTNVWGGKDSENPAQFTGKSYGILSVDGILYMWRCGGDSDGSAFSLQDLYQSKNYAATWESAGVLFTQDSFPNTKGFFCPTFMQSGKDYQGAKDSYVYIYAPENQNNFWNVQTPGQITLIRVLKGSITKQSQYEFFFGLDQNGNPTWTKNIVDRKPVFEDASNGVMRTSVIYNPGLNRYLLITQQVDRFKTENGHIGIYDAPNPWGPWTTVLFANAWNIGLQDGHKTVYWNFSAKWFSSDGKDFVLVFTGAGSDSWETVEGSFTVAATGDSTPPASPTGLTVQ